MHEKREIIILGAGGHCRAIIDVMEQCGIVIAGIIEERGKKSAPVSNYPIIGTDAELPQLRGKFSKAIIGVGQIKSPEPRKKLYRLLRSYGFEIPTIISPSSYVSRHAKLGLGTIVMHQALINAGTEIGENCIINTKALIEHDCHIEDNCHISVGSILCGGVTVGDGSFIGAGAICRENVRIGDNCLVGCGCVIKKDVPDNSIIKDTSYA